MCERVDALPVVVAVGSNGRGFGRFRRLRHDTFVAATVQAGVVANVEKKGGDRNNHNNWKYLNQTMCTVIGTQPQQDDNHDNALSPSHRLRAQLHLVCVWLQPPPDKTSTALVKTISLCS